MSRIRILSEHLANQIAAGEVVERPASVVKELVENSLDAGATRIAVQIEGYGTRLIRVVDNGEGMDSDDVLLCIERHATSKIHEERQLGSISTLGFRGEAIPSIGSVARLTILSRTGENTMGTRAEIRYGILHAVHDDGCSTGTVIEVRGLFANMPARKKFLKSARTERFHIEDILRDLALANPDVGFSLSADGRELFSFAAPSSLSRRVREVFRYKGNMLALAGGAQDRGLEVAGFLLLPEASTAHSARLRILVNGRAVRDATIRHAVMDGLRGFLMKGHLPSGVLLLSIAPELVDINVHPAKREIRFRDARSVQTLIAQTVTDAIAAYQEKLRRDLFSVAQTTPSPPTAYSTPAAEGVLVETAEPRSQEQMRFPVGRENGEQTAELPMERVEQKAASWKVPLGRQPVSEAGKTENMAGLKLIGQLFQLYLLCEKEGTFVVVDQHAAHERLLYGRLRQGYVNRDMASQALLFPVQVELLPEEAETAEKHADDLVALGCVVEHFGDQTWVVKSIPVPVSHLDPAEVFREMLTGLVTAAGADGGVVPAAVNELMASMACKAAVRGGDHLQPQEMLALLGQMEKSGVFSHCPHGRPVVRFFSQYDVERWFHRH